MRPALVLATAAAVLTSVAASAAPLQRRESVPLDAYAGVQPSDRGEVLQQRSVDFAFTDFCCSGEDRWRVFGTIESQVVRTEDGTLDFFFRLKQDRQSLQGWVLGWAETLTLHDFFNPDIHYDARILLGSGAYASTSSVYVVGTPGDIGQIDDVDIGVVPWEGAERLIQRGAWSDWFFFDTNAVEYQAGATMSVSPFIRQHASNWRADIFAPVPVPEPSIWASMAAGLGLLTAMGKRRRS